MVTRALDVVVIGPPGAGKGTQAKRIAAAFQLRHISTGDILREEVAKGSSLGSQAREFMVKGELVPDDLVGKMLAVLLHSQVTAVGCVYDGYPRTTPQAQLLGGLLAELNRRVDVVLSLVVPDEAIIDRITGRRSCPSCRAIYHIKGQPPKNEGVCDSCGASLVQREDDTQAVVAERLRVYRAQTAPLIGLYSSQGILRDVNGVATPDEVFVRMRDAMRGFHS